MFDPAAELDFLRDGAPVFEGRNVVLVTHRPASLELATHILRLGPDGASVVPQLNTDSPAAESVASAVLKSK